MNKLVGGDCKKTGLTFKIGSKKETSETCLMTLKLGLHPLRSLKKSRKPCKKKTMMLSAAGDSRKIDQTLMMVLREVT